MQSLTSDEKSESDNRCSFGSSVMVKSIFRDTKLVTDANDPLSAIAVLKNERLQSQKSKSAKKLLFINSTVRVSVPQTKLNLAIEID